jgi:hypothetical protein
MIRDATRRFLIVGWASAHAVILPFSPQHCCGSSISPDIQPRVSPAVFPAKKLVIGTLLFLDDVFTLRKQCTAIAGYYFPVRP